MMLLKLYRFLNLLSLDIVAGAIVCALFFAGILNVSVLPIGMIVLGLSVWVIYTSDHLLDAYRLKTPASTERHAFHQRNLKSIFLILMLFVVLTVVLLFFIRVQVFKAGILLSGLVLFYLLTHKYLKFLKEFLGAWLYTFGVLTIPLSLNDSGLSLPHLLLFLQFFCVVFFNLLLFSWFDHERDKQDNHSSFVLSFGKEIARNFLWLIFTIHIGLFSILMMLSFSMESVFLLSMNLILFLLLVFHRYFSNNDRFRLAGDAVFFIPIIYLMWP